VLPLVYTDIFKVAIYEIPKIIHAYTYEQLKTLLVKRITLCKLLNIL